MVNLNDFDDLSHFLYSATMRVTVVFTEMSRQLQYWQDCHDIWFRLHLVRACIDISFYNYCGQNFHSKQYYHNIIELS